MPPPRSDAARVPATGQVHAVRLHAERVQAERVQADAYGWLVMWRPWRRCFTAWECRDPARVRVVEAPSVAELLDGMRGVEAELWPISSRLPPRP